MKEYGILGRKDGDDLNMSALPNRRQRWLKRRERWLVLLGILLHAIYMLSIFDIYFKTPIVHGMDPVPPRFHAPAKRLVLLVADGLRADKFFEPDAEGQFRAPFLRSIIKSKGRWGVSHARPPTESRPGHVSIIAGFYEDPSAVTKGWKANPVEFDSVFNRSQHTFAFGSPDIVPIFCGALPHSTWSTYPHEYEDFASGLFEVLRNSFNADASFLDQWSYDQLHNLLNNSSNDPQLKQLLLQDNVVFFLHLLGCDTNGHAHRPYSSIYLNNIKVVDRIAENVYNLLESYFKDDRTAYIFTADHGMSDKGSHGDGHPSNTDTPLVVWGAGVRTPKLVSNHGHSDPVLQFVDQHMHDLPTPAEWGLGNIERVDVNQADIAPLMSSLLGLPCPVNSIGSLPLGYIYLTKAEEVEAVLSNAKQILNQFLWKSNVKQSNTLMFKPFKPLANYSSILEHIEVLLSNGDYEAARSLSANLRSLSLHGLHYFQTYDWLMLMTIVTLGYIGWMINLVLHILQSYTSHVECIYQKHGMHLTQNKYWVRACGCLLMGISSFLLFMERSPVLYHAYASMTIFLWTQIFSHIEFLKALWVFLSGQKFNAILRLLATCAVSIFILEFLVSSFFDRKLYTWCFLIAGVIAAIYIYCSVPGKLVESVIIFVSCWILSIFTLMPAEIPDNTNLVIASGAIVILVGMAERGFNSMSKGITCWSYILNYESKRSRPRKLFLLQAFVVMLSCGMVWLSTSHRTQKQGLLPLHQLINWSISGLSMVLPLFSPSSLLDRLSSIFLGFAPPFLLLSIGYEAVFYSVLALVLMAWVLIECTVVYLSEEKSSAAYVSNDYDKVILKHGERYLQLSDVRVPLIFMVLFNVAFFGTGNFASIASFEISSVYRFITVFSPFLMAALLIFKLFIPFMLVICVFSAITKLICVPRLGCYFVVILFSDVMTIHFFFLVRNTGSWMEIGNTISHFGIMSAQVVFILLLFALTNIYTKDVKVRSPKSLSQKAM